MKHYENLLEKGYFTREQLIEIVGTAGAANSIIYDYQTKGLIEKVKRDFYVVISLETKQPVLSRYQIGSNLFEDACITHHSAFEVYGYGSQVFYECFVATDKRFSDFEYELQMALLNRNLRRNCETIFMMPTLKNSFVSSTLVKEVARLNGDFEKYVPPPVAAALHAKLSSLQK